MLPCQTNIFIFLWNFSSAIANLDRSCDKITCKNALYLNIKNTILLPSHMSEIVDYLTTYIGEKQGLTKNHYISVTMSTTRGIAKTFSLPGKSKCKVFSNSRQTIIWKNDRTFISMITRDQ